MTSHINIHVHKPTCALALSHHSFHTIASMHACATCTPPDCSSFLSLGSKVRLMTQRSRDLPRGLIGGGGHSGCSHNPTLSLVWRGISLQMVQTQSWWKMGVFSSEFVSSGDCSPFTLWMDCSITVKIISWDVVKIWCKVQQFCLAGYLAQCTWRKVLFLKTDSAHGW